MSTKIKITSEIASWLVNGVNLVYTTSKRIVSIDLLTVNSIEYAQYTFNWTTITLDDAPSTWTILVTYSYEASYDYLDNTWWIVGEIMNWIKNSSNKVFTSFYPISFIDEVRVLWVATTNYTTIGNSILLLTAPSSTQTVEIDYFRKDLWVFDFQRDLYFTKSEVRNKVYDEIGQDNTSVQYPSSLVDNAVQDWVTEVFTQMTDKSRFITFTIDSVWYIKVTPKTNLISTFDIIKSKPIPPTGRLMNKDNGSKIDYLSITSTNILTASYIEKMPTTPDNYYVGYRLPRNIKRVVSVNYDWAITQDSGNASNFLFGSGFYFINNGFIYLKFKSEYTLEIELNEFSFSASDDSLIFVDKEDISVVVYYALRQLYQSRESDKLASISQLYIDKLGSYKKRMSKKRSNNKNNRIKTSQRLWKI